MTDPKLQEDAASLSDGSLHGLRVLLPGQLLCLSSAVGASYLTALAAAVYADKTGDWNLFERVGSLMTSIGLALCSRRSIRLGSAELLRMDYLGDDAPKRSDDGLRLDVMASKAGFSLSVIGTLLWGWGSYLKWWSFSLLLIWLCVLLRGQWRDTAAAKRIASH